MTETAPPDRTVLVVDDDPDLRQALVEVLADQGYRTLSAANGAEALAQLTTGAPLPSLILLDVMMPVMDGWEFSDRQQLDPRLARIPVVVLSAHASASALAGRRKLAGFLRKPVELTALLATVRQVCG